MHIVIVNLLIFSMPVSIFTVIILLLLFVLIMLVLLKHLLQDYTKRTTLILTPIEHLFILTLLHQTFIISSPHSND